MQQLDRRFWIARDSVMQLQIREIDHNEFEPGMPVFTLRVGVIDERTSKVRFIAAICERENSEIALEFVDVIDEDRNEQIVRIVREALTHEELTDAIAMYLDGSLS